MFKVNQTQFIEGGDFYHRVAFSAFNADECDDYSVVGARGLQYRRDPGREAVVMSSHIYYGFLPLDIPTQPKQCLGTNLYLTMPCGVIVSPRGLQKG